MNAYTHQGYLGRLENKGHASTLLGLARRAVMTSLFDTIDLQDRKKFSLVSPASFDCNFASQRQHLFLLHFSPRQGNFETLISNFSITFRVNVIMSFILNMLFAIKIHKKCNIFNYLPIRSLPSRALARLSTNIFNRLFVYI